MEENGFVFEWIFNSKWAFFCKQKNGYGARAILGADCMVAKYLKAFACCRFHFKAVDMVLKAFAHRSGLELWHSTLHKLSEQKRK